MASLSLEDMLEKSSRSQRKSSGDTAFIVLESDAKYQLEAAFCLGLGPAEEGCCMTAVNVSPQAVATELLRDTLEKGEPVVVSNLQHVELAPEFRRLSKSTDSFADCHADPEQGSHSWRVHLDVHSAENAGRAGSCTGDGIGGLHGDGD